MMLYLLKSGFCLLVFFVFYKLILESEKMHHFNRFYLIGSLIFSFLIPLAPVDLFPEIASDPEILRISKKSGQSFSVTDFEFIQDKPTGIAIPIFGIVYGLLTGLLLLRFIRHLWLLYIAIKSNEKRPFEGATLVLMNSTTDPYTFLRYIFINKDLYDQNQIEPELLMHELTHVRQRHSLDVIGIEFLLIFFWFNPVLYWIKTAIKLNHEFLADEAVNSCFRQIPAYQRLILSKLKPASQPAHSLSSLLTFQTTKRRFLMMTKQTSSAKAVVSQFSTMLVVAILLAVFSLDTSAQEAKPASAGPVKPAPTSSTLEERYKNLRVSGFLGKKNIDKKYSELTPQEKENVVELPPRPRKSPTDAQFNDWKNPDKFGVWLDGKRIRNEELNKYKPSNIASFWGSYVHKNARRFGKHYYQFDLMTEKYYAAYLEQYNKEPILAFDRKVKVD